MPKLSPVLVVVIDACCVLVFVLLGRSAHSEGLTLAGLARTAWPFLAGLACGELAGLRWRRPASLWPAGVVTVLGTVAVGMALRVVAGQGIEAAFVVVATAFLGLFLLGWRLIVAVVLRRRSAS